MAILSGSGASSTKEGLVRLATVSETLAGNDTEIAITPAGVEAYIAQLVGSAPATLDTLQELATAIADDGTFYTRVSSLETNVSSNDTDISTINTRLTTAESDIDTLEAGVGGGVELDATQTAVGLASDGTYVSRSGTNYLDSATTIVGEVTALDTQAKTNADNVTTNVTNITSVTSRVATLEGQSHDSVSAELDDTQTGAGLDADGTYTANTSANYVGNASSLKDADNKLDAQIKTNVDTTSALDTRVSTAEGNITAQIALGNTHEASVGLAANGAYVSRSGTNYLDSATSIVTEITALDTQVKSNTDGVTSNDSDISGMLTRLSTAESDIDTLESASHATVANELDTTQTGAGLGADGTYTANSGSNYLTAASSLKDADNKLDAQAKTNADAVVSTQASLASTQSDLDTAEASIVVLQSGVAGNDSDILSLDSRVSTAEGDITQLEVDVSSNDTDILNLNTSKASQAELDATQTGVGLGASGTHNSRSGTNYLNSATSIVTEITALDTQVKINSDAISANEGDVSTLSSLGDTHETAIGLSGLGAYVARSGSNYMDSATKVVEENTLLDGQIKTNANDIVTINGQVSTLSSSGSSNASDISAIQAEIDTTQAGAGLSTLGNYSTHALANYISNASSLHDADNKLDAQVKTNANAISSNDGDILGHGTRLTSAEGNISSNDSDISDLQTEIDATQTGAGLASNGAYTQHTSSNYINGGLTLKAVDLLLDAQSKANADAISLNDTDISNLQTEIDATQTGAGLASNGAYAVHSGSNYIDSGASLKAVDLLLDIQSKVNADAIASNDSDISGHGTRLSTAEGTIVSHASSISGHATRLSIAEGTIVSHTSSISTLDTEMNAVEAVNTSQASTLTSLQSQISLNDTDISNLQTEIDATQTGAGLGSNGAYTTHSGSNYIDGGSTLKAVDLLLDAQSKTNADAISSNDTDISDLNTDISNLQTEIDATQAGAGLGSNGAYTAHSGSNYINSGATLKAVDLLLDAQSKTNANAISSNDTDISDLNTEMTATQTGAGLAANGAYSANGSSTYLTSASSLQDADNKLDAQILIRASATSALTTRVTSAEGTITSHTSSISTIEGDVTSAESNISTLQSEMNAVEAVNTSQGSTLTSHGSRLTTLESNDTTQDSDIDDLQSRVSTVEGAYATTTTTTSLQTQITSNDSDISSLTSTQATHTTDLAKANARQGGIWHEDSNTVIFQPSTFTIRQHHGAWAVTSANDFVFIAPQGGNGDRHWDYEGSSGSISFTGVS